MKYCLILRKLHRTRKIFLKIILRPWKIFGPKRDDETGEWRRRQNGELHDLYGKQDIMRVVISLADLDGQGM